MPPSKLGRCCQSVPRCRSCPVWRAADIIALRDVVGGNEALPPHLAGVPRSLHKYEPLLREAWELRHQPPPASGHAAEEAA